MRLDACKLRSILYERDLKQKNLVEVTGLAQFTVNKVCNGGSCTYETGVKIANALNMKLEDLLEKKGA
jgi:DNA-binding Xre family transcriptional regulator